jgi:signal transduction histidine kinase
VRLKVFLSTYFLFLLVLFSFIGIISGYMTGSQTNMLREKSFREFQTISASLARDIQLVYGSSQGLFGADISEAVNSFVGVYARYYEQHGIEISLTDLPSIEHPDDIFLTAEISFIQQEGEHFIHITGALPSEFQFFQMDYYSNITENMMDIRNMQRVFLMFSIVFSVIAAFGLYLILLRIFRPLGIVASASQKIADGDYGERIHVKGINEISSMAMDFNRMAEKIERQIFLLKEEAISKQQFIDNFAHEIRTPLTSIYGYAEYIQRTPFDEGEIIESMQFIMAEANHMKKIANSLLELATLRNYRPVKGEILIRDLFEEVKQTLKKALHEGNIQLTCKNEVDAIEGQEDLIKSLLLNLCLNAIKSCTPNDGVINLEAKKHNGKTSLSVSDNGCGISDEEIARITEPFYRIDKARSREHGGAGLGLTLCRQITEVHGAEMIIESLVGSGTKVTITFTNP